MLREAVLLVSIAASLQAAVTFGQIDDFEDGTTMGWHVPDPTHPEPPANVATGGPDGPDDNYLRVTSIGGNGPGSRMSVLSGDRWQGDYILTGVQHVTAYVRNFGPEDLYLRLLVEDFDPFPGPPVNLAVSNDAVFVPAGSDWMRVVFPVIPSALQVVGGVGSVEGALRNVDTLRLFHNPDPNHPGPNVGPPAVEAQLGIDDITATAIPEPGTWWLVLAGMASAGVYRRCRSGL